MCDPGTLIPQTCPLHLHSKMARAHINGVHFTPLKIRQLHFIMGKFPCTINKLRVSRKDLCLCQLYLGLSTECRCGAERPSIGDSPLVEFKEGFPLKREKEKRVPLNGKERLMCLFLLSKSHTDLGSHSEPSRSILLYKIQYVFTSQGSL